jgi:amino acid transporter/nucleotide-binding universal stress UspA family protein
MMGVGMMIGAGVFVTTGIGIGVAGPGGILMAFALNGLLAFLSVMTYAELSSAIPRAGAGYSYVQESIGGFTGFFCGWISWFAHAVAGSLYAITLSQYTLHFLLNFETFHWLKLNLPVYEKSFAVLMALLFIYINYRGASETGTAGAIMAIGQTIALAIIGVLGILVAIKNPGRLANFDPFLPGGWGKVLVVMGFSLVGYEGYEVIANTAEEAVDAKKNVPKGIFYAVIIVITTYLLLAFAAIVGIEASGLSVIEWFQAQGATGFADAIGQLFPFGNVCVFLAVIFASTSALNATIYSSTRVAFTLGRDGYLPKIFAHISKKTRIPNIALLFSGSIIIVIAAVFPVEVVCAGASIFFIVLFNLVTLAVIKIRKEQGDELNYGYLMPFFPLAPIISFVGRLIIGLFLFDMGMLAYIIAGTWVGIGVVLYLSYSKSHARRKEEEPKIVMYETKGVQSKGYQVMVSVANPATAPVLVKYANLVANARDAELAITTIITVPYQTPLREAYRFIEAARDLLSDTSKFADDHLSVQSILRYGHSFARGIISSVKEHHTDLLILGWSGDTRREHFAMGSTLDPVIEQAPCDLLVVKAAEQESDKEIRRILFPLKGRSPHGKLAVDVVLLIAKKFDAEVTIFHVKQKDTLESEATTMMESIAGLLQDVKHTIKIVAGDEVVKSIITESQRHDIVVIGATTENVFQQLLFGSIPEKIAKGCSKTVLMVKKNLGISSWFRRWFS